jgi:hypothetical protein
MQRHEINEDEIGGTCSIYEKEEKYIQSFVLKTGKKRTPSRSIVGLAGRIIIKWFLKKKNGRIWSGFIWTKKETGGRS